MWLPAPSPQPMSCVCPPSHTAAHPLRCSSSIQLRRRPTCAATVSEGSLHNHQTLRRGRLQSTLPSSGPLSYIKDAQHSQNSHYQHSVLIPSVHRQQVACGAYNVSPTGTVKHLPISAQSSCLFGMSYHQSCMLLFTPYFS